jgi:hypothetical protein
VDGARQRVGERLHALRKKSCRARCCGLRFLTALARGLATWPRITLPYFCSSAWMRGNAAAIEMRSVSPA